MECLFEPSLGVSETKKTPVVQACEHTNLSFNVESFYTPSFEEKLDAFLDSSKRKLDEIERKQVED